MTELKFTAGVLTISTMGAAGLRKDDSGDTVQRMLEREGFAVRKRNIVSDDLQQIADKLVKWADDEKLHLIVTSGGTGLSPNDVTPQATTEVIDFQVPGMAEAMRADSLKKTPHAMISRAVAGVRKACLIINLPGSPKGAEENLNVVLPALHHGLAKLGGDTSDCATSHGSIAAPKKR